MTYNTNYELLQSQAASLISGEHDMIANMANISALLFTNMQAINWAGFYLYKQEQLVLGPFQGNPACVRIAMGKGVCGSAAESRRILRVADVHAFDGHIACDAASNSEIVLPVLKNDQLLGVLDIDSPNYDRFQYDDELGLQNIVKVLVNQIT